MSEIQHEREKIADAMTSDLIKTLIEIGHGGREVKDIAAVLGGMSAIATWAQAIRSGRDAGYIP